MGYVARLDLGVGPATANAIGEIQFIPIVDRRESVRRCSYFQFVLLMRKALPSRSRRTD